MVGLVTAAAVVGAGAMAYSAYETNKQGKKADRAQREANAAQERMASADAARSRIQQAREARIRNAQILASGTNVGMGVGTSGIAGAMGSVTSQAAGNIGTINQKQGFAQEISYYNQQVADARTATANAQAVGQLGSTMVNLAVPRIK